jgi:membrane-associated protein
MEEIWQYLHDPKKMISAGGLVVVLLVVFAENGIFFGFFLPGDTLLFTAGLLCAAKTFKVSIWVLFATIVVSAFLGSLFGYFFGYKTSDTLHLRKDSLFFKKKYLEAAEAFFTKHGGMALIMGRFLPIIRTFAPIFAGIIKFDFKQYLMYNIIGALAWGVGMTLLGYTLGSVYPDTEKHLDKIIIGIIIITWIPVVITYFKDQQRKKKEAEEAAANQKISQE